MGVEEYFLWKGVRAGGCLWIGGKAWNGNEEYVGEGFINL